MNRRSRRVREPLRWIHKRSGDARTTQHVVADIVNGDHCPDWAVPVLCGWVSNGSTHRRGQPRGFGPKTKRSLVTIRPRVGLPICANCLRLLRGAIRRGEVSFGRDALAYGLTLAVAVSADYRRRHAA